MTISSQALAVNLSIALICLGALNSAARAQEAPLAPERQAQIIEALSEALLEHYVLPDEAMSVVHALQTAQARDGDSFSKSESVFLEETNTLLQATSNDKHLRLLGPEKFARVMAMFYGDDTDDGHGTSEPAPAEHAASANPLAVVGVSNVSEISRDGLNQTGYIALERFDGSARSAAFIARVFGTFTASDNIIIDLRDSGGGDGEMVKILSSYFFAEPTHLLSSTMPNEDGSAQVVVERWTEPNALSQYFATKPLAVLISSKTFSAAESFAFGMQASGRAVLVGEATGGGGYMNDFFPLPHGFGASISVGRTYDPRTGRDWQGIGVIPDVQIEQDHALITALTRFTEESGKLDELQGEELLLYEQLQAYANAWYGADHETMKGLLADEFIGVRNDRSGAEVERVSGDQLIADTASGKGQRENEIYYNRIIRDIDITNEQASATLILRETIHHMLLTKINGEWLIGRDDFESKRRDRS
jgi:hypothetical protein